MRDCAPLHPGARRPPHPGRRSQRRAARARRLVAQALLKVVSHTPVECEKLIGVKEHGRLDRHRADAQSRAGGELYTWWSYRAADVGCRRPRPAARPLWVSPALGDRVSRISGSPGMRAAGSGRPNHCAGYGGDRGLVPRQDRSVAEIARSQRRPRWSAPRLRRAAAAPLRDGFRARAGTGCARSAGPTTGSQRRRRGRTLDRRHQRQLAISASRRRPSRCRRRRRRGRRVPDDVAGIRPPRLPRTAAREP